MRAWLGALAGKFLPSLIADAEGEVAAAFKGILKILMGEATLPAEKRVDGHYQSTAENGTAGECAGVCAFVFFVRSFRVIVRG
jgi:hypothetical protein